MLRILFPFLLYLGQVQSDLLAENIPSHVKVAPLFRSQVVYFLIYLIYTRSIYPYIFEKT